MTIGVGFDVPAPRPAFIVVAFATFDSLPFVENWASHLWHIGVRDVHFGLMRSANDTAALQAARVKVGRHATVFASGAAWHGQAGRWEHALRFLSEHATAHVLVSDVDVAWVANPEAFLRRIARAHPSLDMAASTHAVRSGGALYTHDHARRCWASLNVGILFFPANRAGGRLALREAIGELRHPANLGKVDQGVMNSLWKTGRRDGTTWAHPIHVSARDSRLCSIQNGTARAGVLPMKRFCNSATMLLGSCHHPLATHMTWLRRQDPDSKRLRLRELGMWRRSTPATRYLQYDTALITEERLAARARPTMRGGVPERHLSQMTAQLRRLLRALLLGRRLNRTVLLPDLACACEIGQWRGHVGDNCRAHTYATLPFKCPIEHALRPPDLARSGFQIGMEHEARDARDVLRLRAADVDARVTEEQLWASKNVLQPLLATWCCSTASAYDRVGGHISFRRHVFPRQ